MLSAIRTSTARLALPPLLALALAPAAAARQKAELDAYTGVYRIGDETTRAVTRDGDRIFFQCTGRPKAEIFPKSETELFLTVVDAQITFVADAAGKVETLVLRRGGRDIAGPKVK